MVRLKFLKILELCFTLVFVIVGMLVLSLTVLL